MFTSIPSLISSNTPSTTWIATCSCKKAYNNMMIHSNDKDKWIEGIDQACRSLTPVWFSMCDLADCVHCVTNTPWLLRLLLLLMLSTTGLNNPDWITYILPFFLFPRGISTGTIKYLSYHWGLLGRCWTLGTHCRHLNHKFLWIRELNEEHNTEGYIHDMVQVQPADLQHSVQSCSGCSTLLSDTWLCRRQSVET